MEKNKLKCIFILIIIIEIVFISGVLMSYFKLKRAVPEFKKRINELRRNGNYYCSFSLLDDAIQENYKEYRKDGKRLGTYIYKDNEENKKEIYYYENDENQNKIDDINKTVKKDYNTIDTVYSIGFGDIMYYEFWGSGESFDCEIDEFNGKKCYVVFRTDETLPVDIFLDYKTYEIIGIRNYRSRNHYEPTYYKVEFKINTVKDDEIKVPDFTEYKRIEEDY